MSDLIITIRDKFIIESLLLIQKTEKDFIKKDAYNKHINYVNEILWLVQSINKVSGIVGINKLKEFTQHFIKFLKQIINSEQIINKEIINIIFESTKYIKEFLIEDSSSENTNKKSKKILTEFTNYKKVFRYNSVLNTSISEKEKLSKDNSTYYIMLRVEKEFVKKEINLTNIFKELAKLGDYEIIKHNIFFYKKKIDNTSWGVYLITDKTFENIAEVFSEIKDNVIIRKISKENLFSKNQNNYENPKYE